MSDIFKIIDFLIQSKKNLKKLSLILLSSLIAYWISFKFINHFQLGLLTGMPENMKNLFHFGFLIIIISLAWNECEKCIIKIIESVTWAIGKYYKKGKYCLWSSDFIRTGIIRDIENQNNHALEVRSSGAGIISKKGCFSNYSIKFIAEIKNLNPEPDTETKKLNPESDAKIKNSNSKSDTEEPNIKSISGFGFISHAMDHDNYFMLKVDINEPNFVLSVGPLIKRNNVLYIPSRDIRSSHIVSKEGEKFQFVFEVTRQSVQVRAYKTTDKKKENDIFDNKAIYYLPEKYETIRAKHDYMVNSNKKSLEYSGVEDAFFPKLNKFGFRAYGPEILEAENLILEVD